MVSFPVSPFTLNVLIIAPSSFKTLTENDCASPPSNPGIQDKFAPLNEISTKERLLGGCGLSKINRRKKIDHLKTIDFLEIYNLDIMNNRTFLVLQGKCEVILNN